VVCSHSSLELAISILWLSDNPVPRPCADEELSVLVVADDGWSYILIIVVLDNFSSDTVEYSYCAVRGTEIDSKVYGCSIHSSFFSDISGGVPITTSPGCAIWSFQ